MFGIIEILAVLLFLSLCLGTIFWIWMLVDCATKESNQGSIQTQKMVPSRQTGRRNKNARISMTPNPIMPNIISLSFPS